MQISSSKNRLEEAIVETMAFFDMFDFPLTAFELWQYSKEKCEPLQVKELLDQNLFAKYKISEKYGFYFFKGKEINIKKRFFRYNFSERKFKRAIKITKIFAFIPWIEFIAVGNIIGANNLKNNGDIDFFVITKSGRMWLSRLFCVVIIKLLNIRPKGDKRKDTICLSFFIAANNLNIKGLMFSKADKYFVYWLAGLAPMLDREGAYDKFIQSNIWIKKYLPNWQPGRSSVWRNVNISINSFIGDTIDLLIGGLEAFVSAWQQKKLPDNIKAAANLDTRVVISKKILKLHFNDRREYFSNQHINKVKNLK